MATTSQIASAQRALDRAVTKRKAAEAALATAKTAEIMATAALDALVHPPASPAPVQPVPAPTPTPTPQPAPAGVLAAPDGTRLGAQTFKSNFVLGQTFPDATWATCWRDTGNGMTARRTQGAQCVAYYSDASVGPNPFTVLADGTLRIRTDKAPAPQFGCPYYTGMINTYPGFQQRLGYFKVVFWTPDLTWARWPAVWLYPEAGGGPPWGDYQEWDLSEGFGFKSPAMTHTAHGTRAGAYVFEPVDSNVADPTAGFVTLSGLWREDAAITYVNGVEVARKDPRLFGGWPQKSYLVINDQLGSGTSWNMTGPPDARTHLPADMFVKSVEAWALA